MHEYRLEKNDKLKMFECFFIQVVGHALTFSFPSLKFPLHPMPLSLLGDNPNLFVVFLPSLLYPSLSAIDIRLLDPAVSSSAKPSPAPLQPRRLDHLAPSADPQPPLHSSTSLSPTPPLRPRLIHLHLRLHKSVPVEGLWSIVLPHY